MRVAPLALSMLLLWSAGCDDHTLADRAAEVRELWWAYYPAPRRISAEAWRDEVTAEVAAIDDAELDGYAQTYGRLGFFPVDLDLRPLLVDARSGWVGGAYDPERNTVTAVGEVADDALVHEYVHALQDQHFGLRRFGLSGRLDLEDTTDAYLARLAIVEGDAVLAQVRYFQQEERGADLATADWRALFSLYRNTAEDLLASASIPVVFLDAPSFCYPYGLELAAHNLVGVSFEHPDDRELPPYDWGRENQLFAAPPVATTEDVLRFAGEPDPAEPVGLAEVPPELADRLERVDWDQLGEWYTYLLFYGAGHGAATTRTIAASWDGDTALFVRDRQSGAYGVVWASLWDDANAAINAADTLWMLYGGNPEPAATSAIGQAPDGDRVLIERRDRQVVVVKNLADDLIAPLRDAAFAPPAARRPARRRAGLAALLTSH